MTTIPFLEYLHEHQATHGLAEQLACVLALRGRADLTPATRTVSSSQRVAS